MGIAMMRPMIMAITARWSVKITRLVNSLVTDRRVTSDWPKSPRTTPQIQVPYWLMNGRSIPSSLRASASASGVNDENSSNDKITASPGSIRTIEKTPMDTMSNTNKASTTRCAI